MLEKLKSSRFRFINEQLYTMKSQDAYKLFQEDSEAFTAYHEGYNNQTKSWPKNPVDMIIQTIEKMTKNNKKLIIGDFGCGDAKIAKTFSELTVHSFDLVSLDPCVTVCDMASTPLSDEVLDIAVFCLSLMGTNFSEYLVEANRVLKVGGQLLIAEVQSRFDNIQKFMEILIKFGFKIKSKDFSCKYFYLMYFEKERNLGKNSKKKVPHLSLKPCYYKKR
ncbi:Cerebral protein, putative [Pediculus humanus corporis]|uniref:Ribosomal RNA-processing protein 8 n=1 Tax=Pediculus humanus subsp. corporis TaxID=121224 RepID=E0VL01_PEDHC|nr:Cerebral protein, putative [Pediculus humanus corporis]EEB14057.1 Cerebral protein, putative [Pediculus humanus corporis]